MTDVVEGEIIETALTVHEPARLATSTTPEDMIGLATRMATALKDIVERQRLFAVISGKKFPQVEAWMTIGRMDNVVAREVTEGVTRHEDGSYEATVELVRLSDGLVIGRASALCGTADDRPWNARSEPSRRSMAVTRATSRAFRQQYSWIMALAGYEPTPAEEMPRDDAPRTEVYSAAHPPEPRNVSPAPTKDGSLIGTAEIGTGTADYEIRQEAEHGWVLSFRLVDGKDKIKVTAFGALAEALSIVRDDILGQRVTCWGKVGTESFPKNGKTITYPVLTLERIQSPTVTLPAPDEPALSPEDERELDAIAV